MWLVLATACWPLAEIGRYSMKCAMALHDPCGASDVLYLDEQPRKQRIPLVGLYVPLCGKHVVAFDNRTAPFAWQTIEQLERWARDAAERAKRQEARTA
jgi:hypothetical protein